MRKREVNAYAEAVAGYPSSWFVVSAALRWLRRLPEGVKVALCSVFVVAIGVQTFTGMELARSAALSLASGDTTAVRWDCINSSAFVVHLSVLALLRLIPILTWCLQALSATIFPAIGIALSVVVIAGIMGGEERAKADVDMKRWFPMFVPVVGVLILFVAVILILSVGAHATHYSCPPLPSSAHYEQVLQRHR